MKKKTEKEYFNELWTKMKAHLKAFIKDNDQEDLHQFRVQIKKIRAMLTLFDASDAKYTLLKDFKPVKKIFKHGGQIRDAFIHLQLGKQYHLENSGFAENHQQTINEGILEFKHNKIKYLKTIKRTHALLESSFKPLPNSYVVEFYVSWLSRIAADIGTLEFNDTLHSCRKQIKVLLYNIKFTEPALRGKLNVNIAYLDKLQDSIGKWHDNDLAISLFSSEEVNEKEVVRKLKAENTKQKKIIADLAADFWVKATLVEDTALAE